MLTVAQIKSLKPKTEKYDVMDGDSPGLGVRVMPSGSKSFMFRYRVGGRGGKVRRMILGQVDTISLKDARGLYTDARRLLELGTDPLDARVEAAVKAEQELFFADLAKKYLAESATKLRWANEELRIFNHDILPAWRKRKAKDIKKRDVVALLDKIVARGAPTQANRVFGRVRRLFTWAVEKDLVEFSPCVGIKAPSKEQTRDRVLSDEEIRQFWTLPGLSLRVLSALQLQLLLGQRIGEISGMRWSEIDTDAGLWTLPAERAKNGVVHTIPLTKTALSVLEALHLLRNGDEDLVFPATRGKAAHLRIDSIGTALTRAIQAAGMAHFTPHDLRRTAATRISGAGTSREVLRQILNHVDRSVTARYDRHRYDSEKRAALEAWERVLLGIVTGQQASNVISLKISQVAP